MDQIIIRRDINVIFKITTEYSKQNLLEYLKNKHLQQEIIDILEENIDFKITFDKISENATENQKKNSIDITYNNNPNKLNGHIYITLKYKFINDIPKIYNKLTINYLKEIIDKYIVKFKDINTIKQIEELNKKLRAAHRATNTHRLSKGKKQKTNVVVASPD